MPIFAYPTYERNEFGGIIVPRNPYCFSPNITDKIRCVVESLRASVGNLSSIDKKDLALSIAILAGSIVLVMTILHMMKVKKKLRR